MPRWRNYTALTAFRYLRRNWETYLAEIPEFFEIIWTDNDFWPGTFRMWRTIPDSGEGRVDLQAFPRGSPPFGRATYFPDLIRYSDRLVWCLIGLPMGLLAVVFLPRQHRRWASVYMALVPYLVIPFIASAFPRYRIPAVPLVFVLAGQSVVACWECRPGRTGQSSSLESHDIPPIQADLSGASSSASSFTDSARAMEEGVKVPSEVLGQPSPEPKL